MLEALEASLASAFDIRFAFNKWTLGERFCTETLGFSEAELADALRSLVKAEFLTERALYPEAEYAFKHPLTRDVAYDSQLREPRVRVHTAVAQALETLHADALDEHAALLAHHRELAGEREHAALWHRRAAEWIGASDYREARRHWTSVRELAAAPETPEAVRLAITARSPERFVRSGRIARCIISRISCGTPGTA